MQAGELLSQKGGNTLTNLYAANKYAILYSRGCNLANSGYDRLSPATGTAILSAAVRRRGVATRLSRAWRGVGLIAQSSMSREQTKPDRDASAGSPACTWLTSARYAEQFGERARRCRGGVAQLESGAAAAV